jgi:hypothetical protein
MNPQVSPGAGISSGQTVTGVGVATQLTTKANVGVNDRISGALILTALTANSAPVFIGGSNAVTASNGLQLAAGASLRLEIGDPSRVWLFAAAAQTVSWLWY